MIADAARRAGMLPSQILEFEEYEPIVDWLNKNLTGKDSVLIKGSHSLRMDRITTALEAHP
jgi:UDP-N-acetylmuramoyl-tripeptide--D-alanyl-D-alanine ligase